MNIPRLSKLAKTLDFHQGAKKPAWNGIDWWFAVNNYFEIYPGDAQRLFNHNYYPASDHKNPRAVADRIREFIENGHKSS